MWLLQAGGLLGLSLTNDVARTKFGTHVRIGNKFFFDATTKKRGARPPTGKKKQDVGRLVPGKQGLDHSLLGLNYTALAT